jgi:hypothetical protein
MATIRGNWWEATYTDDPSQVPIVKLDLGAARKKEDEPNSGFSKSFSRQIVAGNDNEIKKISSYTFEQCDFTQRYEKLNFEDCTFSGCRFDTNSIFVSAKFSNCKFRDCHFGYVTFQGCKFNNCEFSRNTAAADYLILERTSINASKFLDGLTTNLKHVHEKERIEYQQYKLAKSLAKIAQTIFVSTKEESDQDLFFEAHKQATLRWTKWKAARKKYKEDGRLVEVGTSWKQPPKHCCLWFWTNRVTNNIDYCITYISGFFTDWGRSIARPATFFVALVLSFSGIYYYSIGDWCDEKAHVETATGSGISKVICAETEQDSSFPNRKNYHCREYSRTDALIRAVDVSLVAGYTKYSLQSDGSSVDSHYGWLRLVTFVNMIIGLYWYALIIPVILRRIVRS